MGPANLQSDTKSALCGNEIRGGNVLDPISFSLRLRMIFFAALTIGLFVKKPTSREAEPVLLVGVA